MQTTPASVRVCALVLVACLASCASVQRQGDKAFENGNCEQALELYDEAEAAGVKDPQMFHNGARCALQLGDLALAERKYSYALRYGAGVEVARELAGFYVRTSNYVSAVRVYQYLLHRVSDKQALYNNLGTALMYAGKPFDAESYLMIAQQMSPEDPTPYVNLGLLYDRHLKQPWLAINFYDCYNELTQGRSQNAEMVAQRASELRDRYFRLYERDAVACGKAYQPAEQVVMIEDLKKVVEDGLPEEEPETPFKDAPVDPDKPPLVVEPQITDYQPPTKGQTPQSVLEGARNHFQKEEWAAAVGLFTSVPVAMLTPQDQKQLGIAYKEQANWAMSSHWLELSLTTREDPEIVSALFDVYRRSDNPDRISTMCKRYRNDVKYEKIIAKACNTTENTEE